ncbi:MAG: MFS transporter [Bifidobacterium sp.]
MSVVTHNRNSRSTIILAIILISYFIIILDNSVIFTALPDMTENLMLTPWQTPWVQDAYTLVFGGLLLLGSRLGDLMGRRKVFIIGLALFTTASFMVGVAQNGWWVIGARALQGIGSSIVAPSSLSLLTASFSEGRERNRAVAWYGATAGIGASLGLVIGGACAQLISWRAGFFINVPIGIAMMVLAPRYLPVDERKRGSFDAIGAALSTMGVGSLVFGILHASETRWLSTPTVISLLIGAALLVLLVVNESKASQPIMPMQLFADRERFGAYIARFLYMAAMIGFFYFMTQYMQNALHFTPLEAGLGFLPMTAINFVAALQVPLLSRKIGSTTLLIMGVTLTLAGFYLLSLLSTESSYAIQVGLPMLLIGAGQGFAFAPLTSSGIVRVAPHDAGAASGLVNTFHQVGMSLGLGVLVASSSGVTTTHSFATQTAQVAAQVSAAFSAGTVILIICLVSVFALVIPGISQGKLNEKASN